MFGVVGEMIAERVSRLTSAEMRGEIARALAAENYPLALFWANEADHLEDWEHDYGARLDGFGRLQAAR
jgi:hypothetical protein